MKLMRSSRKRIIEPCTLEYDYQIDPYIGCGHQCHYCYAQNAEKCDFDWENEVKIYPNLEKRLKEELLSLEPQEIYLGMNTDPYQPFLTPRKRI